MSYYYNYYIGYKKDNKIYPLGPYDCNGNLKPVISKSSSYASDLHKYFHDIEEQEASNPLKFEFEFTGCNNEKILNVQYLLENELPSKDFIKKGYFLIDDIKYLSHFTDYIYDFEGFYNMITPEVYAAKLQHEITFGKNLPKKDIEDYEYSEPNASDYMYYAYPDFNSKEYESYMLSESIEMLRNYSDNDIQYVILKTEG